MYSWLDQLALFAPSLLLSSNPLMATALKVMPGPPVLELLCRVSNFLDKNIGRGGIRRRASFWICVILIWICGIFYSDLWDWLNCWGGVEATKEGTKGPPWPGLIQQRWVSTKPPFNWEIVRIQTFRLPFNSLESDEMLWICFVCTTSPHHTSQTKVITKAHPKQF